MRQGLMLGCMLIVFTLLLAACDSKPQHADDRKWLAERTKTFLGVYKVAYDRVYTLQGPEHPCTRGHKAEPAAVFHATLTMLHKGWMDYQRDVDARISESARQDAPIRDMLSVVERVAKPFADKAQVERCGSLPNAAATEQFFLQTPLEAQQAVTRLEDRINEATAG